MGIVALVMAGGKGTRMRIAEEKPLIKVCGKPVIEYVLAALKDAKKIDSIIVATSSCTPKTTQLMKQLGVQVIETPGKDYVSDMGYAVQTLKLGVFLAIAADLPLVKGEMIDAIVERYEHCGKPALTVAVPLETKAKLGMCIGVLLQNRRQRCRTCRNQRYRWAQAVWRRMARPRHLSTEPRRISRKHQYSVGTATSRTIAE